MTLTVLNGVARRIMHAYLRVLARRMLPVRPVHRVPGWWSGHAFAAPTPGLQHRLAVFEALRGDKLPVRWYDGMCLELRVGNDISKAFFAGGEVDPNEFAFLADFLRPGMCVIDGGANEGLYTLFFRKRVGDSGRVIAIEPNERETAQLERNLRQNRFAKVEIHRVALGERDGTAMLQVADQDHAGHNALGRPAAPWVGIGDETEVPLTTLDILARRHDWPKVDLIKLDLEGMEFAALRGAEWLLSRDHPVLLLEAEAESLTLRGDNVTAMLDWLKQRGYCAMEFSSEDGLPREVRAVEPCSVNLVACYDGPKSCA